MPTNTQELANTFDALKKVDVSDIIISMAMGVAKAQEKLDDNSIKQLLRLSEQEVAGKSLLELGFVPAFYVFDYVDISASIHLTVTAKSSSSFGLEAKIDFAKLKGYSKEDVEMMEKSKEHVERKEFKSSKSLLVRSSESKSVKIQNSTIKIDQSEGSIKKLENFNNKIRQQENISRAEYELIASKSASSSSASAGVFLSNHSGYINIYIPNVDVKYGILQIKDYTLNTTVTLKTGLTFDIGSDLTTTLTNINTANVLAGLGANSAVISFPGKSNIKSTILEIYYDLDRDIIDESYVNTTYNNADVFKKLKAIEMLLKANPSISIKIEGNTDSSGPYDYNVKLSERRAKKVKEYFTKKKITNTIDILGNSEREAIGGGKEKDIKTNPLNNIKDPKYRKVVISLIDNSADYIYFQGPNFATSVAAPGVTTSVPNKFVVVENFTAPTPNDITFSYGTDTFVITGATSFADFKSKFNLLTNSSKYDLEMENEVIHILHEETQVKFTAYNSESEEIAITNVSDASSSNSQTEDTWMIDDTYNKEYEMKRDAEKIENPGNIGGSASIDIRASRQFDITADGNASFSARLKSLPPPVKFNLHIESIINSGQ